MNAFAVRVAPPAFPRAKYAQAARRADGTYQWHSGNECPMPAEATGWRIAHVSVYLVRIIALSPLMLDEPRRSRCSRSAASVSTLRSCFPMCVQLYESNQLRKHYNNFLVDRIEHRNSRPLDDLVL